MYRFRAVVVAAAVATAACDARDAQPDRSPASVAAPAPPASASSTSSAPAEAPLACATLRDVGVSDVVRVEGTTLLYADGSDGLKIVDVADAQRPRQIATIPFVGTPIALFVRDGTAWLVFTDSDARFLPGKMATVVRAVDVRVPSAPRVMGEVVRDGSARDAKLVAGVLYTIRESGSRTVVESYGTRDGRLEALGTARLGGAPAQLAASAAGLAAVTVFDDHSEVSWIDLPLEQPGALFVRETVRVPGGVATWVHGDGHIVTADEGQRVRLVSCTTRSCGPTDAATLRVVDFDPQKAARLGPSLRLTERGGLPLTRFQDETLYFVDGSILHVVKTEDRGPRTVGHVSLRGVPSSLVPRDGSLVVFGKVASPESAASIVVQDIDVRTLSAPRIRSTVTFGSDWTWSVALDDADATSFDPGSQLMSIPFTAWREADKRYVTGTQLVDLGPSSAQIAATIPADSYVERAVFLDGRLVTVGPNGATSIDYAAARRHALAEHALER